MKNTNLLTLIGVIVVLAGFLALAIKGCNDKKQPQPPTFTQLQIDSVVLNSEESAKIVDELISRNNKVTIEKDSLLAVVDETGRKLEIQGLKSSVLTREVQLARGKIKDLESAGEEFIAYAAACDSLLPVVDSLVALADTYRGENRSLQASFDSLLSNNQFRIARAEFDRDFNKEKFDTLAQYTLALEKSKGISDKKAKKRLGIGPALGASYWDGKFRPVASISLQYHIIRF